MLPNVCLQDVWHVTNICLQDVWHTQLCLLTVLVSVQQDFTCGGFSCTSAHLVFYRSVADLTVYPFKCKQVNIWRGMNILFYIEENEVEKAGRVTW